MPSISLSRNRALGGSAALLRIQECGCWSERTSRVGEWVDRIMRRLSGGHAMILINLRFLAI